MANTQGEGFCTRCQRPFGRGSAYILAGEPWCFYCAARYRPLLRRSAHTTLVVGTILVAINLGPAFAAGEFPAEMIWKISLNYVVPFCVATWGALGSSKIRKG